MSEELIVRYCSPTLAGMKTGSLFTCSFIDKEEMINDLRNLNNRLKSKGLRVLPMRIKKDRALIYIYRPKQLKCDFSEKPVRLLLEKMGYSCDEPNRCITKLISKLRYESEFPHEIGLFLGYPPEDVKGFIENAAACSKCSGCWKVYGNKQEAEKLFEKYRKCTDVYCAQWKKGKSIERLTVAV